MGRKDALDDSQEAMSYRPTVLGLIAGLTFLLFFCYHAGMSLWVFAVFFSVYLVMEIAITRMRAEVGTPVHDLHYTGPDVLLTKAVGTRRLGAKNLTMFTMFWFLTRSHYSDVMPHNLEALKMADMMKADNKGLLHALVLATIVTILCFFWIFLHVCYETGMENRVYWFGWQGYNRLGGWITNPSPPDSSIVYVGIGFLITIGIALMRNRFLWFILHPAGYPISSGWGMEVCWIPIFISWSIKFVLLRFGGLKMHRRAIPLFLGLILGEFIVGIFWSAIRFIFGIDTYGVWFL